MKKQCEIATLTKKGKTKKHRSYCQLHSFTMKPISNQAKIKNKTSLNLCPILNKQKEFLNRTKNQFENIFPIFNNDGKCHIPAFTLQNDIVKIYQTRVTIQIAKTNTKENMKEKYQRISNKKVNQQCSIIIQFEPKPLRKTKYCAVCRNDYDDYRIHIQESEHKKIINKNKFNKYINQMCRVVGNNQSPIINTKKSQIPSMELCQIIMQTIENQKIIIQQQIPSTKLPNSLNNNFQNSQI